MYVVSTPSATTAFRLQLCRLLAGAGFGNSDQVILCIYYDILWYVIVRVMVYDSTLL